MRARPTAHRRERDGRDNSAARHAGEGTTRKRVQKEKNKMAEKKAAGGARGGIAKPVTPSPDLAKIVGKDPLPRSEVVSKMWEYIKKHNLQNPENKREILADATLEPIFGGKKATMFEMNKHLSKHMS